VSMMRIMLIINDTQLSNSFILCRVLLFCVACFESKRKRQTFQSMMKWRILGPLLQLLKWLKYRVNKLTLLYCVGHLVGNPWLFPV
jgi:hypothetical protein